MPSDHLRFSPDILRRLGEELIPHVDQGIIELVRNSYDADAVNCKVELINTNRPGGILRITDDGVGMTSDTVRSGWLILGRSSKSVRRRTALRRLPVGDKGLGRLAALRMGARAHLITKPKKEPGIEYKLTLDWSRFDSARVVEDVDLEITRRTTQKGPGTVIEVENLHVSLGRREVQRLARSLLLLADPFQNSSGFRPQLIAPGFSDLERRVKEAYFSEAQFKLSASIDENGKAKANVFDASNNLLWTASEDDLKKKYEAPAAAFDLWVFLLDRKRGFSQTATLAEVRQWLEVVGGVHLYHRGLRVHPYGDEGHDWLEMNLARVRSPELRPSTNTTVGRVVVLDPSERLIQKTDRTGFIENDAFAELRQFAIDSLNWMARERLREREKRREGERLESSRGVATAKRALEGSVDALPLKSREKVESSIKRLERAVERELGSLRAEVQLYRTLATVGTTTSVFAHESAKPATQIERMAKVVESRAKKALGSKYEQILKRPIAIVLRAAQAVSSFSSLPLYLLKREKRRSSRVDVNSVIVDICSLLEPYLADASIEVKHQLTPTAPMIRGTIAGVESIIANLLINAVNAFNSPAAKPGAREILIRTELSGERLLIGVLDNGPGIMGISIDDIWLPGETTIQGGTGLGLTIVRDTVLDLAGKAYAVANGELGGAEFIIEVPVVISET